MKKTHFKTNKIIYFSITNKRTIYYRAKLGNKKIFNKVQIAKDKFFKDIARLKKVSK